MAKTIFFAKISLMGRESCKKANSSIVLLQMEASAYVNTRIAMPETSYKVVWESQEKGYFTGRRQFCIFVEAFQNDDINTYKTQNSY